MPDTGIITNLGQVPITFCPPYMPKEKRTGVYSPRSPWSLRSKSARKSAGKRRRRVRVRGASSRWPVQPIPATFVRG